MTEAQEKPAESAPSQVTQSTRTEAEKKALEEKQLVVFSVNKEEFGVDITEVREIIKVGDITRIPNAEHYIKGVINLRGKIIVVIDLAKKIMVQENQLTDDSRIVVVEIDDVNVGILVDSANEVIRIPLSKIKDAPKAITDKINADYIQGVGIVGERLLILLEMAKVIGDMDVDKLTATVA